MEFNNLEKVPQKLERLQSIGVVWFDKKTSSFVDAFTGAPDGRFMVLTPKERAKLIAVYKRAYTAYTTMACVSCREHRLIVLEIELGTLLHTMEIKYG